MCYTKRLQHFTLYWFCIHCLLCIFCVLMTYTSTHYYFYKLWMRVTYVCRCMNCVFYMCRPRNITKYKVWRFAKETVNHTALYSIHTQYNCCALLTDWVFCVHIKINSHYFLPVVQLSQIPTAQSKGNGKKSNLNDRLSHLTNYDDLKLSVVPVMNRGCWYSRIKPKHLALTVNLYFLVTTVQIPGEWSVSSWGSYDPIAMERKPSGVPGSVVFHLTDRHIVTHKVPVKTRPPNSDKP